MGDRANVVMHTPGRGRVFLYTHWAGSELPETVRQALDSKQGRGRWSDDAYLARIIFSRMIKGEEDDEGGFGIAAAPCDNQIGRPYVVVDCEAQEVRFERPSDEDEDADGEPPEPSYFTEDQLAARVVSRWSFADYCAQSEAVWPPRGDD